MLLFVSEACFSALINLQLASKLAVEASYLLKRLSAFFRFGDKVNFDCLPAVEICLRLLSRRIACIKSAVWLLVIIIKGLCLELWSNKSTKL